MLHMRCIESKGLLVTFWDTLSEVWEANKTQAALGSVVLGELN